MGISATNFYFKEGIPAVIEMKNKFEELTGLQFYMSIGVNLVHLSSDNREISYKLYKDQGEWERVSNSQLSFDKRQEIKKNLNTLEGLSIACWVAGKRYGVYVENVSAQKVSFIYAANESNYFTESLIKTMLELGGRQPKGLTIHDSADYATEELAPYNPYKKRWKRLKKWEEYTDLEKLESQTFT